MLQNRVDPFGRLIKTKARGAWLGNRGVIHNDAQEIVRPYKVKAWIICMLKFRGRHRQIMQPNRWTELFFLDEATAFAAGHRPCFQCRYEDHQKFKTFWLKGNPRYAFDMKTPISEIDAVLHTERIAPDRSKAVYTADINSLPNGTFIAHDEKPYLVKDKKIYLWSPAGYAAGILFPGIKEVTLLTPRSIVNTFRAGYVPQMSVAEY